MFNVHMLGTANAEIRIDFGNVFYYFDDLSNNKLAEEYVTFRNKSSDRIFAILANNYPTTGYGLYFCISTHFDLRRCYFSIQRIQTSGMLSEISR